MAFLCVFAGQASLASARQLILHIVVADSQFHLKAARSLRTVLEAKFPAHTLYNLEQKKKWLDWFYFRTHKRLVEKARSISVAKEDRITHLVISCHGATIDLSDGAKNTFLMGVGHFGPDEVSEDFLSILKRVQPNLAPNLRIALCSCETAADGVGAIKRIEKLAQTLSIPDATIYCAVTPELVLSFRIKKSSDQADMGAFQPEDVENSFSEDSARRALSVRLIWAGSTLASIGFFLPQSVMPTEVSSAVHHFSFVALQFQFPFLIWWTKQFFKYRNIMETDKRNRGLLFSLKEGSVSQIKSIVSHHQFGEMFGFESCSLNLEAPVTPESL